MRTARNAGSSVGQSFDDEIDFGGDLLPQRQRRNPRVGRLGVVPDGDAALDEPLAEPVQKAAPLTTRRSGRCDDARGRPREIGQRPAEGHSDGTDTGGWRQMPTLPAPGCRSSRLARLDKCR